MHFCTWDNANIGFGGQIGFLFVAKSSPSPGFLQRPSLYRQVTTAHHHMAESEWPQSLPLDVSRTPLSWCLEGSLARPHGNKPLSKDAALILIHSGKLWRSRLQDRRIGGCCSPSLVRHRLGLFCRLTTNTPETYGLWERFVKPSVVSLYIQQAKKTMFTCFIFCSYKMFYFGKITYLFENFWSSSSSLFRLLRLARQLYSCLHVETY